MLDTERIQDAITTVNEDSPDRLEETVEYTQKMEDGDETTLDVSTPEWTHHIHITWNVPIELMSPTEDILPDSFVDGDTEGLPVAADWVRRSKEEPPTEAYDLGADIWNEAQKITTAIEEHPYPTTPPNTPYVVGVFAETDPVVCTIHTGFVTE